MRRAFVAFVRAMAQGFKPCCSSEFNSLQQVLPPHLYRSPLSHRSGAAGAIDALRAAGYDVLVGDHIADPESAETVYLQVYGWFNCEDADIEALAFAAGAEKTLP